MKQTQIQNRHMSTKHTIGIGQTKTQSTLVSQTHNWHKSNKKTKIDISQPNTQLNTQSAHVNQTHNRNWSKKHTVDICQSNTQSA